MSAYKVIEAFVDLQDDNHVYHVGDKFPHNDIEISEKRINDLLSRNNRRKMPLIEKIEEKIEVEEVLDTIPEEVFEAVPEIAEEVIETVPEIVEEVVETVEEIPNEAEVELMNPPEEVVEVEEVKTTHRGRRSQK